MKTLCSVVLAASLGLSFSTPGWAGLLWLGAWEVDLDMNVGIGSGSRQRAFGATAVHDGDIKDVTAEVGVARAEAMASTNDINPMAASRWSATVDFERGFRLTDWLAGWSVNLQGLLSGSIANQHPEEEAASAVVRYSAAILDKDRNELLTVGDAVTLNKASSLDLFDLLSDTVHVAGGDYFVTGHLFVSGLVLPEPLRGDVASRFFDGGFAVSLSVAAAEPPTWALLLFLVVPAAMARARRANLPRPIRT